MPAGEENPRSPKRAAVSDRLWRLAIALSLVATTVVLYYVGKPVLNPFKRVVELDSPVAAATADEVSAIIDSSARRLLVLDGADKLVRVVSLDTNEVAADEFVDVCIAHDKIYVVAVEHGDDTPLIHSEFVLEYSTRGVFERVLWSHKTEQVEDWQFGGVCGVVPGNDGVFVVAYEDGGVFYEDLYSLVNVWAIDDEGNEELVLSTNFEQGLASVRYSAVQNLVVATTVMGSLVASGPDGVVVKEEVPDGLYTCVGVTDDGHIYAYDDVRQGIVGPLDSDSCELLFGTCDAVTSINAEGDFIVASSDAADRVMIATGHRSTRVIDRVACTAQLRAGTWAFWVASAYLLVFVLLLIARRARAVAAGNSEGAGSRFAALAVLIALVVTGILFIQSSWSRSVDSRKEEIAMLRDYLHISSSMLAQHGVEEGGYGTYTSVIEELEALRLSAAHNNINLYYRVYCLDAEGQIRNVANSIRRNVVGSHVSDQGSLDVVLPTLGRAVASDEDMVIGRSTRGLTIRTAQGIYDGEGNLLCTVELGSQMTLLEGALVNRMAQLVITLLVALMTVYMVYAELRASVRSLVRCRQLAGGSEGDAAALIARPLGFLGTFMRNIDSVMMSLIAKELLAQGALDESLVFLPALALGLGIATGYLLYGLLAARVTLRDLYLGTTVGVMCFSLVELVAVMTGGFWVFCIGKYLASVFFGIQYVATYLLPRQAQSGDIRSAASMGSTSVSESAPALATVVGGGVALNFGDAWLYALVAAMCVLLMVLVLWWSPSGHAVIERQPPHIVHKLLQFLRGPVTIGLVAFVVIPRAVMGGYASFLFPLFASGTAFTKMDISNFSAIGRLVTYLSVGTIVGAKRTFKLRRVVGAGLLGAGVVFALLGFNHSLAWSVIVIGLVALMRKLCGSWKGLWFKALAGVGIPQGVGISSGLALQGLADVAKPLLLGALLSLGKNGSVFALGGYCLVCVVGFVLTTRGEG